jgi:hypothetical protein
MSTRQNPTHPDNLKSIAREAIAVCKEGASVVRVHCRDQGKRIVNPDKKLYDLLYTEAPGMITNICTILSVTKSPTPCFCTVKNRLRRGRQYCRSYRQVENPISQLSE